MFRACFEFHALGVFIRAMWKLFEAQDAENRVIFQNGWELFQ